MAYKLISILVSLNFFCVAFCAVSISLPSTNPDYPGKCWDNDTKKAYAPGDVFTAPTCTRVTCGSDFSFDYATCGTIATSPPCYTVDGDLSLPYPKCCPQVKCDELTN